MMSCEKERLRALVAKIPADKLDKISEMLNNAMAENEDYIIESKNDERKNISNLETRRKQNEDRNIRQNRRAKKKA